MRKVLHIMIDTVLFSADLFHIIFHPFHRPSKWQMQYFWFPKKGAAGSHSVKDRSPIDTFLEKASATAFPRKVCFSTYQWAHWLCTHLWSKTIEVEFEIYRDCAFCTDFVRLWGKFTSRVLPLIDRNCRSLYSGNIKWCFLLSFSIRSRASQSILAFTIVQCSNSCCKIFASSTLGGKILGPDMTPIWQKVLSAIAFPYF